MMCRPIAALYIKDHIDIIIIEAMLVVTKVLTRSKNNVTQQDVVLSPVWAKSSIGKYVLFYTPTHAVFGVYEK